MKYTDPKKYTYKQNVLYAASKINGIEAAMNAMKFQSTTFPHNSIEQKMYLEAVQLLDIELDANLKTCYTNLKELYS